MAWIDDYKKFLESQNMGDAAKTMTGNAATSYKDGLVSNSNKINPTPKPQTSKQTYDAIPEATKKALGNAGVQWDNNYNAVPKVVPKPTSVVPTAAPIGSGFTDEVLKYLQGAGSGKTLAESGMDKYYVNKANDLQNRLDQRIAGGNNDAGYVNSIKYLQDALKSYQGKDYSQFANWDTGLLDVYVRNKSAYDNAQSEADRQRYAMINQQLRDFYGMTADTLDTSQASELQNDLLWANFIRYGLNKEDETKIPVITSTDMQIDPKFEAARMLARRDNLWGYEPIGKASGAIVDAMSNTRMNSELEMLNRLAAGQMTNDLPLSTQIDRDGVSLYTGQGITPGMYDQVTNSFVPGNNTEMFGSMAGVDNSPARESVPVTLGSYEGSMATAVAPDGNTYDAIVANGVIYLDNGQMAPEGWLVQLPDGLYHVLENGKGLKIE